MIAQTRRGMTLIELLVVIVIISILAAYIAVVLVNMGSEARKRKALADIAKLSIALSEYKNRFGEYPPDTGYGLKMDGTGDGDRPCYTKIVKGVPTDVPTYDPGSLWRYLCQRVWDPDAEELVGPILDEWSQSQTSPYDDRWDTGSPSSRYLIDPWGNPYGFIGDKRRVIHNHGAFDIFSAGPDGVTACNNGKDDPLIGSTVGDKVADSSDEPQANQAVDNRAYNTEGAPGEFVEIDDDGNDVAGDSEEFGPEAIRNGDIGDDINNWSSR